jgi:hypothetical protein
MRNIRRFKRDSFDYLFSSNPGELREALIRDFFITFICKETVLHIQSVYCQKNGHAVFVRLRRTFGLELIAGI